MINSLDNKGQSIQVGFILVLGIIILFASLIQINQVPVEEQFTEEQHREEVYNQIVSFTQKLSNANQIQTKDFARLQLGTNYEGGFIFATPIPKQNSLDPQGTIRASSFSNSTSIQNSEPLGSTELKNKWSTSTRLTEYNSNSFLEYSINYNHINDEFKYVYENSLLYVVGFNNQNQTEGSYGVINNQNIIRGNTINLPIMEGSFRNTGIGESQLITTPVSTGGSPIQITNDSSQGIKIRIPTKLPVDQWENLLEPGNPDNNVRSVTKYTGTPRSGQEIINEYLLEIQLEPGKIYNLQTSKISLSTSTDKEIENINLPAAYAKSQSSKGVIGDVPLVISGSARDRYHNPTSNLDGQSIIAEANQIPSGSPTGQFSNGENIPGSSNSVELNIDSRGNFKTSYYSDTSQTVNVKTFLGSP